MTLEELLTLHENNSLHARFFDNISDEVYHHADCPGISKSALLTRARSEAHYQCDGGITTRSKGLGTALHLAFLKPYIFENTYTINDFKYPDGIAHQSKEGRRLKAEYNEANKGKELLSHEDYELICGMLEALNNHSSVQVLMKGAVKERAFFHLQDGVLMKAKPDILLAGNDVPLQAIVDIKTTKDARAPSFKKDIASYMYDVQGAYYLDVVNGVLGTNIQNFILIAVENTPPHGVMIYNLDAGSLEVGRSIYKEALAKVLENQKNQVKSYPTTIESINLPAYAFDLSSRI